MKEIIFYCNDVNGEKNIVKINYVILDLDGVFTDGSFTYSEQGKIYKVFGAHDADGLKLLKNAAVHIDVITADKRGFEISKRRMEDMDVRISLVSDVNRLAWVQNKIDEGHNIMFMGDGLYDAFVFKKVKYGIAPKNACEIARKNADFVTNSIGGSGAVLEAVLHLIEKDMVLIPDPLIFIKDSF